MKLFVSGLGLTLEYPALKLDASKNVATWIGRHG